jgi:hypothetical protein
MFSELDALTKAAKRLNAAQRRFEKAQKAIESSNWTDATPEQLLELGRAGQAVTRATKSYEQARKVHMATTLSLKESLESAITNSAWQSAAVHIQALVNHDPGYNGEAARANLAAKMKEQFLRSLKISFMDGKVIFHWEMYLPNTYGRRWFIVQRLPNKKISYQKQNLDTEDIIATLEPGEYEVLVQCGDNPDLPFMERRVNFVVPDVELDEERAALVWVIGQKPEVVPAAQPV